VLTISKEDVMKIPNDECIGVNQSDAVRRKSLHEGLRMLSAVTRDGEPNPGEAT